MTEVYLALGSNVGDSRHHIELAIKLLKAKITDLKEAPVYASKAVGYTDQPDFLNTAVSGHTDLTPEELLSFVKEVEQEVGRIARFRWGPREIDVDIIFYGDQIVKTDNLTVPHAEFSKRDFVLRPICDLNPDFVDPVSHKTVKQVLDGLGTDQHAIK